MTFIFILVGVILLSLLCGILLTIITWVITSLLRDLINIQRFKKSDESYNKFIPTIITIKPINIAKYIYESIHILWITCFYKYPIRGKRIGDQTSKKKRKTKNTNSNQYSENITMLSHFDNSITIKNIEPTKKDGNKLNEK